MLRSGRESDGDPEPGRFDDLGRFDGGVTVRRTRGELAAECHEEAANFLALNLAHEVLAGGRSVDEARLFYAETIAKKKAGGSPAYTGALRFDPPRATSASPTRPSSPTSYDGRPNSRSRASRASSDRPAGGR